MAVTGKPIGTREVWKDGYVHIKTAKGWRAEHREVCAQALGRSLRRNELVHHVNEVKTDNRPENLRAVDKRQHALHHLASHHTSGVASRPSHHAPPKRCSLCGKRGRKSIQRGLCSTCRANRISFGTHFTSLPPLLPTIPPVALPSPSSDPKPFVPATRKWRKADAALAAVGRKWGWE